MPSLRLPHRVPFGKHKGRYEAKAGRDGRAQLSDDRRGGEGHRDPGLSPCGGPHSWWSIGSEPVLPGYVRVSTTERNLGLRNDALLRAGCGQIYEDAEDGTSGEAESVYGRNLPTTYRLLQAG